jgi:hypothetical protein
MAAEKTESLYAEFIDHAKLARALNEHTDKHGLEPHEIVSTAELDLLRADKARMDWLDQNVNVIYCEGFSFKPAHGFVRAAVDRKKAEFPRGNRC